MVSPNKLIFIAAWAISCTSSPAVENQERLRMGGAVNEPPPIVAESPIQSASEVIWSQKVGASTVTWAANDLWISANGKKTRPFADSLEEIHEASVTNVKGMPRTGLSRVTDKVFVTIKSAIGSVVTFEVAYVGFEFTGGVGSSPSTNVWWLTLDLEKTGDIRPLVEPDIENARCNRIVNLRELFGEEVLIAALLNNPEIMNSIATQNRSAPPTSLKGLFKYKGIRNDVPRIATSDGNYWVTPYSLEHFVFERVEGNEVIVKIALTTLLNSEIRFLEIALPIPPDLLQQVRSAANRESGFLGHMSESISGGRRTEVKLETTVNGK